MLKKEKALQIFNLTFLLKLKVIFLFQHDFAKNTNWVIHESSVRGSVQTWKSLKLLQFSYYLT